jgi:hypothetical protein
MIPVFNIIDAIERNLKHAKGFELRDISGKKYIGMVGSEIVFPIQKFHKDKLFFPIFLSSVRDSLAKTRWVRFMAYRGDDGKRKIIVHDKGFKVYEFPYTTTGVIDGLNKAADIYEKKEKSER